MSTFYNPKRTAEVIRADRKLAPLLAASGYTQQQIAEAFSTEEYSLSRRTIAHDVAKNKARIEALAPTDPSKARLLQIERLEALSQLCIKAFLESRETTTTEIDAEDMMVRATTKKSAGDKGFLVIAKDIEIERSKILGVYAPKEIRASGELVVSFTWGETAATTQDVTEGEYRQIGADSGES